MAKTCADELVTNDIILGLGSGSAVARFAKALGERSKKESLRIKVVPSSIQSWMLARENSLDMAGDTSHCPETIDLTIDGADQIAIGRRAMIKGGGGALLKEKIIISASKSCYILGDESKFVPVLSRSVPVEVVQFAVVSAGKLISEEAGAKPELRKLEKGYPYDTESGNIILDCHFKGPIEDPVGTERKIKSIPGVVECGIFNSKVHKFFRAKKDGTFDSN